MQFLSAIVFVPFVGWGAYVLHRKYARREDIPAATEGITLICVLLFFAFELGQLRTVMHDVPFQYAFTILGMFVAAAALYGHMAVALASRFIVDMVTPAEDAACDRPRFGPAEMLERQGDYEGALGEYMVLARIFPGNPSVHVHAANTLLELERPEDAFRWFQRSLRYLSSPGKCLAIYTRMAEIHEHVLGDPDEARHVLDKFLMRFPDAPESDLVQAHRDRIGTAEGGAVESAALEILDANPIEEEEEVDGPGAAPARASIELEPLEAMAPESACAETRTAHRESSADLPGIEAITAPVAEEREMEGQRHSFDRGDLEPL